MAGENEREHDEDEERDEDEGEEGAQAPAPSEEAPDVNAPRNRAERRAMAKAARRGRSVQLGDADAAAAEGAEGAGDALIGPNTSIGGETPKIEDVVGARRPKVPPRTISKGTGNAEGVPEWALRAGDWFTKNRTNVVTALLAALVLSGGFFGWRAYTTSREARASGAYADALQTEFALITPEEPGADDPRRDLPHYRTFEDRERAALQKLRRAEQANPSAQVTPLVRLTEASTLYQLGRYAEAKQLYQAILGHDLAGLEGRAVEGLAFALESLGDLDGAMARYRELQNVQGGAYRDQAQYYQARLLVRRNDNARAKDLLHGVIERLGHPAASDPTAAFQSTLREQSLALLRDIDPSDPAVVQADRQREAAGGGEAHGHGPGGADALQGLPPELRQQLEKALRERGAPGGR